MPIGGLSTYNRFGHAYNVTRILDSTGRRFDLSKYETYISSWALCDLYVPGLYKDILMKGVPFCEFNPIHPQVAMLAHYCRL